MTEPTYRKYSKKLRRHLTAQHDEQAIKLLDVLDKQVWLLFEHYTMSDSNLFDLLDEHRATITRLLNAGLGVGDVYAYLCGLLRDEYTRPPEALCCEELNKIQLGLLPPPRPEVEPEGGSILD